MKAYYDESGVTLYCGDCRAVLAALPEKSVNCCVTSPPYWNLRDYGTATWEGGDEACDHVETLNLKRSSKRDATGGGLGVGKECPRGATPATFASMIQYRDTCGKCGAIRIDAQIGLEPTPEQYVAQMVSVFREVRRVLRDDGTLWLNLGDSYVSSPRGNAPGDYSTSSLTNPKRQDELARGVYEREGSSDGAVGRGPRADRRARARYLALKPKDLVGIPWLVAFALRADGWYLRSDIIWSKPNPMPESVTDRPTKAHEYLFLLSKSPQYFYDADRIREPLAESSIGRLSQESFDEQTGGPKDYGHRTNSNRSARKALCNLKEKFVAAEKWGDRYEGWDARDKSIGANKRTVWTIPTFAFPEAHFATFPPKLIEPCILAGCPGRGKRCDCDEVIETPLGTGEIDDPSFVTGRAGFNRPRRADEGTRSMTRREQRGYAEQLRLSPHRAEMASEASTAFDHYIRTDDSGARPIPPDLLSRWKDRGWLTQPPPCNCPIEPAGVVLDPFFGAGTTGLVAQQQHVRCIGIELNESYCAIAKARLSQGVLPFATGGAA